jgi:hypothetical protein
VHIQLQPLRVREQPRPDRLDLLAFVKGNCQQYEVRNASGGQERFHSGEAGLTFYQVKNAQWAQFFNDNDFIYRDIGTSPCGGRYFQLPLPNRQHGSHWLRRRIAIGETYTQARQVQFYNKAEGSTSTLNSGDVADTIKLVAPHQRFTFRTGHELDNVIEIHWVQNAHDHTPREEYLYEKDFGLVGWERGHQDPHSPAWSTVSEVY